MAEKTPQSSTEKVETKEKQVGDVSTSVLTPEDKTECFEETGYGSAPGSSEVMSGTESSIWTSDDPVPEDTRKQQESSISTLQGDVVSEVTSSGLDISSKPADLFKKPTRKKPKLGFFKKTSPVPKHVALTAELTENLIPPEEEDKTKFSPHKIRSRSKFTSGLPKLVSLRKTRTIDKSHSCPPTKQEKDVKSSPTKSPVRKLSCIPTPVISKKQRVMVPLSDEIHGLEKEKEMSVRSPKSPKSKSSSKAKSSVQTTSVQTKHGEVKSQTAESGKDDECSVKPKRAPKFSLGKFKTKKHVSSAESPLAEHLSPTDARSGASSATSSAFALVRKGIKKMDVSGKLKKGTKKAEETRLIEKDEKVVKAKSIRGEDESSEDRSLNEPYVFKKTSWKPVYPAQEGGLLAEDMIAYVSSSEKDTTPTEMSTLSDSLSLIRGKSKSQRSRRRTLDSMSKVSSLDEEEIEGTAGVDSDVRPQLQRQTNVPDLETEEDPGDVFSSPEHKVTSKKESEHETKE